MINRIKNEILRYFPVEICNLIDNSLVEDVCEIRIRINRPIILKTQNKEIIINHTIKKEEISNGFITISGGHRIGISGKPLYKNNKIYMIKDISGLNFRIAREVIGFANSIIPKIKINNEFVSTLIISPPGIGKTTLLRDLVRQISNSGYNVSLIDERSEIASCYKGIPQNDIGDRTDIMDAVYKVDGIKMMVRSMRPDFIATDEIGTDEDAEAIFYAVNCGTKILATAHGNKIEDLYKSKKMKEVLECNIFEKIVLMSKTEIKVL